MSESDLYAGMKSNIKGSWTRIENSISSGQFDTNAVYGGVEAWIELKTFVGADAWYLRPLQFNWMAHRLNRGGSDNMWILAAEDDVRFPIYCWPCRFIYEHRERLIPTKSKKYKWSLDRTKDAQFAVANWADLTSKVFGNVSTSTLYNS